MQMKLIAISIVISIVCSKVHANFNSTQKEEFKIEFGCIPQENWNLFENHDKIVRNVCIDSNYQTHTEPRRSNYFYPILFRFERTKILDVDGIKRTFTMNFCVIIAWEDPRVKADFGGIESFIDLPPITTNSRAKIWTPFSGLDIDRLIRRQYVLDPIIARTVTLNSGALANEHLSADFFTPNETVIMTEIDWIITMKCDLIFSSFPFDENTCPVRLFLGNMNVTAQYDNETHRMMENLEYASEGYDIKETIFVDSQPVFIEEFNYNDFTFGFIIEMERQFRKYFFQYYLPCIIIVVASRFSFIIPLSAIPGRVALVVTQFLTLTNIFIHQMVRLAEIINVCLKKSSNLGTTYRVVLSVFLFSIVFYHYRLTVHPDLS